MLLSATNSGNRFAKYECKMYFNQSVLLWIFLQSFLRLKLNHKGRRKWESAEQKWKVCRLSIWRGGSTHWEREKGKLLLSVFYKIKRGGAKPACCQLQGCECWTLLHRTEEKKVLVERSFMVLVPADNLFISGSSWKWPDHQQKAGLLPQMLIYKRRKEGKYIFLTSWRE